MGETCQRRLDQPGCCCRRSHLPWGALARRCDTGRSRPSAQTHTDLRPSTNASDRGCRLWHVGAGRRRDWTLNPCCPSVTRIGNVCKTEPGLRNRSLRRIPGAGGRVRKDPGGTTLKAECEAEFRASGSGVQQCGGNAQCETMKKYREDSIDPACCTQFGRRSKTPAAAPR